METHELDMLKIRLLERRRILAGDVGHLAEAVRHSASGTTSGDLSNAPYHMADIASDAYEEEFTFRVMESGDDEILAIDDALEKMSDGTYGECEDCGRKISNARLRVVPQARLCIRCKRIEEGRTRPRSGSCFAPPFGMGKSAWLMPTRHIRKRA